MTGQSQMHAGKEPASNPRALAIAALCLGTWVLFLRVILSKV